MAVLENQAKFSGLFGENGCEIDFSSNLVSTTIVSGLTATKTADKKCWVDGPLNYAITIVNNSGDVVTGLVLTDYLDPSIVTLDEQYGVFINDEPAATYTFDVGMLSVSLPTMADGDELTVTFRVVQV